ncbi:MAG: type II secretion system secretin GspD [Alphaproteobacteria bacterium]|nr:type II secretion system secretin GspD [Alphaproteobacteria bacterium]
MWRRFGGQRSIAVAVLMSVFAAGCTAGEPVPVVEPPAPQAPMPPPPPAQSPLVPDTDESEYIGPKVEIFSGTDTMVAPAPRQQSGGGYGPGDVTLDFADADVKDVVRTVLGDILKVPFAIDPQVQGKITLKTSRPLRKQDVISALETALRVNNAVIVLADNVYNVVPATEASRRIDGFEVSGSPRTRLPGYGIEVVPLRYIAAAEMQKILQPVSPANGILTVDATRNLLFLAGTGPERATMVDTIHLFDVDYMRGMSYALVHPDHVDAAGLAQELNRVFQNTRGAGAGLIRFVPLARLNTLLVVAPRANLLKDVQKWVMRLDVPPKGPGRRIYFYRLQNAKAEDVARSLAAVYGNAINLTSLDAQDAPEAEPEQPPLPANGDPAAPPPPPVPQLRPSAAAGLYVAVDNPNNALIIRADGTEYSSIERFLKEVDIAPDQVLMEVTIVEVTLNDTLKFGVEWFFKHDDQKFNLSKTGTVASQFPGFSFTYVIPDVEVAINALGTVSDINVISSPKLLTLNNKPAILQVGDQVPIIVQSATGIRNADDPTIVNSVQFRDTGIVLRATPRIGKSGMVFVDIHQEVSDAVETTTSGIDSPTIQQRKLSTTVAVHDGESIALGGLIKRNHNYSDSGIPGLKDVPLLGKLFGSTTVTGDKTELLVFLRPRIIRSPAAAREMTDQLRTGLQGLEQLMEEAGHGPHAVGPYRANPSRP